MPTTPHRTDRIASIVTEQGEVLSVTEARQPGKSYGRMFHTQFTHEAATLARTISSAATLRVFLILPDVLSYQHFKRLDQRQLGAELGLDDSSISRALKQLHSIGVVEKRGAGPVKEWRLSSDYGWRGDVAGFHAFNRGKTENAENPPKDQAQKSQKEYVANKPQRTLRLLRPIGKLEEPRTKE